MSSRISTDIDFNKAGKQTGFLRLPYSTHRSAYGWIPIPIVCIRNGEGPTVLLVSGNHGDEYEGQFALIKLCRSLTAGDVGGRIIILPAANFPAVLAGQRVSPIDSGNLNRTFPGHADGTPTSMIAHFIETMLLRLCDFVVDLHSGGSSLMYLPSALVRRYEDRERLDEALALLKAFGAPIGYLVDSPMGEDRTLMGAAQRSGALIIGTELGGGGSVTPETVRIAENGVRRVLAHIGVIKSSGVPAPRKAPRLLEVGGSDYYVYAADGGLFEPYVDLGDEVEIGQPAGAIHFPDTPWRAPNVARFERAGMVMCKRVPGLTERGDCLFHLGTDYSEPSRARGDAQP